MVNLSFFKYLFDTCIEYKIALDKCDIYKEYRNWGHKCKTFYKSFVQTYFQIYSKVMEKVGKQNDYINVLLKILIVL